jgi:nitrogen fixation NifU-like protein
MTPPGDGTGGSSASSAAAIDAGRVRKAGDAPLRGGYSDVIRGRWRQPRFRGDLPGATAVAEDVNPLCGDRVRMAVALDGQRLRAVRFTGDSCAICTASADVLAELAEGRDAMDALALGVADVLEVLATDVRPTRMRCVTLPVIVLSAALGRREDGSQ